MIKIKEHPGDVEYKAGKEAITEVVKKRADINLFAEGVLNMIIDKTGGSLRDLFNVIVNAGMRADNRKSKIIELKDAEQALIRLKSQLARRIDGNNYEFLINILKSKNKRQIEDREHFLKMM
jgi:hypothetical protein